MNTQEILNDLTSNSDFLPITVTLLQSNLKKYTIAEFGSIPDYCKYVFQELFQVQQDLIKNLNLPLMQGILKQIKIPIMSSERKEVKDDLKITREHTLEEITEFLTKLHKEIFNLQTQREEIFHFISHFTTAKNYVVSFISSFEIVVRQMVKDNPELKFNKDQILNDSGIYKDQITQWIKDLNQIQDEILSPRINHLNKMESSVRLLEKYRTPENGFHLQRF